MKETSLNPAKKRNGTVDLMRFVFTLMVVAAHMISTYYLGGKQPPFANGHISVELFFTLSGFLMARKAAAMPEDRALTGRASRDFVRHKFATLYPVWFTALCATFLVRAFQGSFTWDLLPRSATSFLMISSLGFRDGVNIDYSYYIPIMLVCCALTFPFLYRFRRTFTLVIAPLTAFFCALYLFHTYGKIVVINGTADGGDWLPILGYPKMLRGLCGICLGCCAWELSDWMKARFSGCLTGAGRGLFTALELLLWAIPILIIARAVHIYLQLPLMLFFALAVAVSFADLGHTGTWLSGPFFGWLGRYSYAVYLSQFIPRNILERFCPPENARVFVPLYFAVNLVCGLVFLYVGELLRFLFRRAGAGLRRLCLK